MKLLIVGGTGQGKAAYAKSHYPTARWLDGADCPLPADLTGATLDHLHLLLRRQPESETDPRDWLDRQLVLGQDWVILCDELGSGVVPADRYDRRWREETGRLCCRLAEQAEVVIRMFCGLPQFLKETGREENTNIF